jgi:hypothetical protein
LDTPSPRTDRSYPATGKLTRTVRGVAGHPGQRQHGRHPLPALAGPQALDTQRNPDVLRRRQHRHEPEGLEDEGNPVAPQREPISFGHLGYLAAVDPHPARRRGVQAADDVQQRGLAGA